MAKSSRSIDIWREYFSSANSDIYDVIKHAIMVAAMDNPKEFKSRRDQIAELIFSCKLTKCFRCDEVGLAVPNDSGEEEEQKEKCCSEMDARNVSEDGLIKENQVNFRRDEDADDHGDGDDVDVNSNHHMSNYSYGEVEPLTDEIEALTDEIEEETQMFREVLRIKEVLENWKDESDSVLFNSLRRLQLMDLSVEILKATEIGKAVKVLLKHGSEQIKMLAKTLVKNWMDMVDEWLNSGEVVANVAEGTPESVKKSDVVDEEEGLPSPPLDEGAFFLTETAPMEWGEFFDGMDDDGNPRNSGEFNKNRENGRKPTSVKNSHVDKRKQNRPPEPIATPTDRKPQQLPHESAKPSTDRKGQQLSRESITTPADRKAAQPKKQEALDKKQATVTKPNKPSLGESGPGRPAKLQVQQNVNNGFKSQRKPDRVTIQKRESTLQPNKSRNSDETAELVKLEASKRKLQERYQEAQNAKKQRTVQVMELRDIPKQDHGQRNPHMKPGNHGGRFRANGRR